jgi:hypothetical protein
MDVIDDLHIGDDWDVERDITLIPDDAVLERAWLLVKGAPDDPDSAALITKEIDATEVAGTGQITDTGEDETGHVLFQITPEDNAVLEPWRQYWWWIKVLTDTGKEYTPVDGMLIPKAQGIAGA